VEGGLVGACGCEGLGSEVVEGLGFGFWIGLGFGFGDGGIAGVVVEEGGCELCGGSEGCDVVVALVLAVGVGVCCSICRWGSFASLVSLGIYLVVGLSLRRTNEGERLRCYVGQIAVINTNENEF
jgi:hypothetical protein